MSMSCSTAASRISRPVRAENAERWNMPTINPAAATAICDDKALCSLALEASGVPTPRTMLAFSLNPRWRPANGSATRRF